jgi:FkbM family methyltransferase
VRVEPAWARAYRAWELRAPNHPGKRTLLRLLRARRRPFGVRLRTGTVVVVSPREGDAFAETVGWSCFLHGEWEPHVERALRAVLRPGDAAVDVGANLGYFSIGMAQAVGPTGRVDAFEPVPPTFARLAAGARANDLAQLHVHAHALGSEHGEAEIAWDERIAGSASLHGGGPSRAVVEVRRLDELGLPPPRAIKLDVEGHELEVLRGARETIASARPAIVLELNARASRAAGWAPVDLARELDGYSFAVLAETGERRVDLATIELGDDDYVDVLARPTER